MAHNYDKRQCAAPELRLAGGDDTPGTFAGYASLWDVADSYGDVIKRGAFARSIATGWPRMLWSHDPAKPVGTWTRITEDDVGLRVEGKLSLKSTAGADAHALLADGALDGLSIGFRAKRSERGTGGTRVLHEIELIEISLVTIPAAGGARVTNHRDAVRHARVAAFTMAARRTAEALKKGASA